MWYREAKFTAVDRKARLAAQAVLTDLEYQELAALDPTGVRDYKRIVPPAETEAGELEGTES